MEQYFSAKSWRRLIRLFNKELEEGKYEPLDKCSFALKEDPYSGKPYNSVELRFTGGISESFYTDEIMGNIKFPIYTTPSIVVIGYNDKDYSTFETEFLINDNSFGTFLFDKVFYNKGDETMATIGEYRSNTANAYAAAGVAATAAATSVEGIAGKIGTLTSEISTTIDNIAYDATYVYDYNGYNSYNTIINNKVDKLEYESLSDRVKKLEDKNKEEGKDTMMKNLEFGPCGDDVRISAYGLAIRNNSNEWVSYNAKSNEILNVDILNISNSGKYIYKMPVAVSDVKVGDVIIHNKVPMFVSKINNDETFAVVDVKSGEAKTIIPTKSPFGFNFMVKIVSLLGTLSDKASADKPFGNILPFLLMDGNKDNNAMMVYALTQGGSDIMANPMMAMALLGGKSIDPMMLMMLDPSFRNPNANTVK